jgi:hypothetical protein
MLQSERGERDAQREEREREPEGERKREWEISCNGAQIMGLFV